MADPEDFSPEGVEKFLLANGGKATNVQVVGHFAKHLNDPEFKVLNRQKFKDYINEVATVKTEKGEKLLVLKNEYFYKEWIEPKHVIIRSAQSQHTKPSWPPPAPQETPMDTASSSPPTAPARRKKKSHDHTAEKEKHNGAGSSTKPKSGSPRPQISAPIYTGPVEQKSVVSIRAGEKVTEELSQIEGVQGAKEKFELESRMQTPSPQKPASSTTAAAAATAVAVPSNGAPPSATTVDQPTQLTAPPPIEIQVTNGEEREEEKMVEVVKDDKENVDPETKMDTTPSPPMITGATAAVASTIQGSESLDDTPNVKLARQLFEREAQKEAAAAAAQSSPRTPRRGGNGSPGRSPRSARKKQLNDRASPLPHHHHDDDDHALIGSDLAESNSSDTLRSIKSTSSGNSFPDATPKLEPLEHQWMMESAKANIPALMGLLEQEPGLVAKKDFLTGFSALHWGAKHGKKEMIRLVVDRGGDVNMRSQGGYTPLHIAAMHNKEAIMQFLVSEYHADINRRDFSGRKPRHYLQTNASNYIKQMMQGRSTADVIQPASLMSLAEPKQQEEKRSSRLSSILRTSFRHSFRLWGSAENLEDKDHKRDRTPPVTPPPSPKSRPKSGHPVNYSQSLLMPPPSGYTVPNRSKKSKTSSDKNKSEQLRKSESNPDMLSETTPATYV